MRKGRKLYYLVFAALAAGALALSGCSGSDGSDGSNGLNGKDGKDGNSTVVTALAIGDANCPTGGEKLQVVDPTGAAVGNPSYVCNETSELAKASIESCAACHEGAGSAHQAVYADTKATTMAVTINSIAVAANATLDTTVVFTITKDGLPFTSTVTNKKIDRLSELGSGQQSFDFAVYDPVTNTFPKGGGMNTLSLTSNGNGQYTLVAQARIAKVPATNPVTYDYFDVTAANNDFYMYIARGLVGTAHGHVQPYSDVVNVGKTTALPYTAAVTEAACGKCHGLPYLKHGYRGAKAAGLNDFVACKNCHYDTRVGTDSSGFLGTANASWAYTASLMQDTHLSHMNEFPYPQAMNACVTCHPATGGKLAMVLTDANFTRNVCTSCHVDVPVAPYVAGVNNVQFPLSKIVPQDFHITTVLPDPTAKCEACHVTGNAFGAPLIGAVHAGYDATKYSSVANAEAGTLRYTYSIDAVAYTAAAGATPPKLTITWSAKDAAGTPVNVMNLNTANGPVFLGLPADRLLADGVTYTTEGARILVGYYGWGTHNVAASDSFNKTVITAAGATTQTNGTNAVTTISLNPTKISDNHVTTLNVSIVGVPIVGAITTADTSVAVKSVSKDFAIPAATGAATLVDRAQIVDDARCNTCHDNIVIHKGDSHGHTTVGNVDACLVCHNASAAAGSLEQQSRSIDSYIHGIHAQGALSLDESVAEAFVFPTFTTQNCEACHVSTVTASGGKVYDVPSQYTALGGVIASDDAANPVTVGPASRACGSCHRALDLYEDDANSLAAINQHTAMFGYRVPKSVASFVQTINYVLGLLPAAP